MKTNKLMFGAALMVTAALLAGATNPTLTPLEDKVRHEIAMLPYYTIFDQITFRVDGGVVTLFGDVRNPVLKDQAGNVVKKIEGVDRVANQIEVLPLSDFDQRIRMQTARAIYGFPTLQHYGVGTLHAIHIIVKDGNVTLTGFVSNDTDKEMAFINSKYNSSII